MVREEIAELFSTKRKGAKRASLGKSGPLHIIFKNATRGTAKQIPTVEKLANIMSLIFVLNKYKGYEPLFVNKLQSCCGGVLPGYTIQKYKNNILYPVYWN